MGVRFPSVFSTTFIGPLPINANETVVLTTPALSLPLDGANIFLMWFANMTAGTSVTAHTFRIRRGTTVAGTLIGAAAWSDTLAATNLQNSSGWYVDTPGNVAGQQYSLTVVQTGAAAAGTWNDGALLAFVL